MISTNASAASDRRHRGKALDVTTSVERDRDIIKRFEGYRKENEIKLKELEETENDYLDLFPTPKDYQVVPDAFRSGGVPSSAKDKLDMPPTST